jgi:hypothetical protein
LCIREVKAVLEAMIDDEEQIRTEAVSKHLIQFISRLSYCFLQELVATPFHIIEKEQKKEEKAHLKLRKDEVAQLLGKF